MNRRDVLKLMVGAAAVSFAGSASAQISDAENAEIDTHIEMRNMLSRGGIALWYQEDLFHADVSTPPVDKRVEYIFACDGIDVEDRIKKFFQAIRDGREGRTDREGEATYLELNIFAGIDGTVAELKHCEHFQLDALEAQVLEQAQRIKMTLESQSQYNHCQMA